MNLRDFKFPSVTEVDFAFPTFPTDRQLLEEARARGFYNGHTPYNKLFSDLFFNGSKAKWEGLKLKDVPEEFMIAAGRYMRVLMGSFAPKHEEKEAVCAMILSEIVEVEDGKAE